MLSVGLFVKPAEAGQIREIDTPAQRKHRLEQVPKKAALPSPDLAVVNVGHFPENGGDHRREKRLSESWAVGIYSFGCESEPTVHCFFMQIRSLPAPSVAQTSYHNENTFHPQTHGS